jgi:hypothetical protein
VRRERNKEMKREREMKEAGTALHFSTSAVIYETFTTSPFT